MYLGIGLFAVLAVSAVTHGRRFRQTESMVLQRQLDGSFGLDLFFSNITFDEEDNVYISFEAREKQSTAQVFRLFVANESMAITMIEFQRDRISGTMSFYRHPHSLEKVFSEPCPLSREISNTSWRGQAAIDAKFLPKSFTKYSMAVIQESSNEDHKIFNLCSYTVINAVISALDFMVLGRYKVIGAKY